MKKSERVPILTESVSVRLTKEEVAVTSGFPRRRRGKTAALCLNRFDSVSNPCCIPILTTSAKKTDSLSQDTFLRLEQVVRLQKRPGSRLQPYKVLRLRLHHGHGPVHCHW